MRDSRPNYIYRGPAAKSALDYADLRRPLRPSSQPASVIGPCLAIILLATMIGLAVVVYQLARPVMP